MTDDGQTGDYIVLEFPQVFSLDSQEEAFVLTLHREFKTKDFFVRWEHDCLKVFLCRLDVERLTALLVQADLPAGSVFYLLLEKVAGIGSYGVRAGKRIYVNYQSERKVQGRKSKEKDRQRFYYTRDHEFSQNNQPLPAEFQDRIICADSEEFLKSLPDNCIDLIFTSPPYNFGLEYPDQTDSNQWELYFDKLFRIFAECIRVTTYGGRIIVNVQPLFSDYIPSHHLISQFFIRNKMLWKGEILWEKNNYNCKYTAWGSWKSPSSPYLKYTWEFIEVFCKGDLKKKGDSSRIDISADEFKQWVVARWSIAPERRMKEYGHPAMFPEQLAERVLKLFSYREDVIMDPFNGTGTTCAVAQRLGRHYLGIDNSAEYCARAEKRLQNDDIGDGWLDFV